VAGCGIVRQMARSDALTALPAPGQLAQAADPGDMLRQLLATFLGPRRRRPAQPRPAAPAAHASASGPAAVSPQRPAAPPSVADVVADVVRSLADELGEPPREVDPEAARELAGRIARIAEAMPPPSSFPQVATQLLGLVRDPDVAINDLVGLVQRDAAIASTLVRLANSPAFAPAVPITTLRGAIQGLGVGRLVELVVGAAGRSYYDIASAAELAVFPALWQTMFDDALANAFTAGRLALDVPASHGDGALFAGLLADVGRPIALRILTTLVRDGLARPDDALALRALDDVAGDLAGRAIAAMDLPRELRAACLPDPDRPSPDAQIARLVAAIGAIQRRGPSIQDRADEVGRRAEQLRLGAYQLRSVFAQRAQYMREAAELFGTA
jgi:HD-like signal output (HDOD) protein